MTPPQGTYMAVFHMGRACVRPGEKADIIPCLLIPLHGDSAYFPRASLLVATDDFHVHIAGLVSLETLVVLSVQRCLCVAWPSKFKSLKMAKWV